MVWDVIIRWHVPAVGHIDKEFAPEGDGRALNEFGFDAESCEALFHTAGCCGSIHDFICSQSEVSYTTDAGMHDQRSGYLQQQHPVPGCFARYEWCTIRHDVDADASVAGSSPYASFINSSSSSNSSNPIEQSVPGLDAPPALSETFESW